MYLYIIFNLISAAPPPTPPGLLIPYFDDDQYLGKDEPYAASGDLPYDTMAMEMSPDGSEWWIGGQTGDLVAVCSWLSNNHLPMK